MSMEVAEHRPLAHDVTSLRAILDCHPDSVFVWDREHNCLGANRAAVDRLGTTADKAIAKNILSASSSMLGYDRHELIDGQKLLVFAPEHRDAIAELIACDYAEPYESVMIRKDGTRLLVETVGNTMYPADRNVRVAAVRDVSERKKAEARMKRTMEDLGKIFEPLFSTRARGVVGLELPMCRNLIEANGGTVSVRTGLGKGCTFVVVLPLAQSTQRD